MNLSRPPEPSLDGTKHVEKKRHTLDDACKENTVCCHLGMTLVCEDPGKIAVRTNLCHSTTGQDEKLVIPSFGNPSVRTKPFVKSFRKVCKDFANPRLVFHCSGHEPRHDKRSTRQTAPIGPMVKNVLPRNTKSDRLGTPDR